VLEARQFESGCTAPYSYWVDETLTLKPMRFTRNHSSSNKFVKQHISRKKAELKQYEQKCTASISTSQSFHRKWKTLYRNRTQDQVTRKGGLKQNKHPGWVTRWGNWVGVWEPCANWQQYKITLTPGKFWRKFVT